MPETPDYLIARAAAGHHLSREQTAAIFEQLMTGRLAEGQIERLLTALADKGETVEEIVGAATVMRQHVIHIPCDAPNAIDTCGTGGDGISTFNVSTSAAIVAAAAGAVVAKHGNRSNTRKSGSAEVLAALGVDIEASAETSARCLRDLGIGFLHAARLHPAMKYAVAARRKLARPTIFNLLGPLTNPAGVRRQIIGVPRVELMEKIATVLRELGSLRVWVVHGDDGLCDLTITGPSRYVELRDGQLRHASITPEELGLTRAPLDALRIQDPSESAAAVRDILDGGSGPRRDHTLLNAAAALVVAGVVIDLPDGLHRAGEAVDNGAAKRKLDAWTEATRGKVEN